VVLVLMTVLVPVLLLLATSVVVPWSGGGLERSLHLSFWSGGQGSSRSSIAAASGPPIAVLAEHGGVLTQLAADGDFVYAALGSRVLAYPAEYAANSVPVAVSAPTGRMLDRLAVTGDGLVLATTSEGHPEGGWLLVYRGAREVRGMGVSAPVLVGELRLPRTGMLNLGGLVAAPGAAWLAADELLLSIDLSRPERPREVGRVRAPQQVAHLARTGSLLLAAVRPAVVLPGPIRTPGPGPAPGATGTPSSTGWQLQAYDLAVGDEPRLLSSVALPIAVTALAADERHAVAINDGPGGMSIVAIGRGGGDGARGGLALRSTTLAGEALPMLAHIAPQGPAVAVRGDVGWLVRRDPERGWRLYAIELSAPEPRVIAAVPLAVNWPAGMVRSSDGEQLHLALGEQGLLRTAFVDRAALGVRRIAWAPTGRFGDMAVDGTGGVWAMVGRGADTELVRLERSSAAPREVARMAAARGLAMLTGDRLVVMDEGRLEAWDVADPQRPFGPTEIESGELEAVFPRLLHGAGEWLLFEEAGTPRMARVEGRRVVETWQPAASTGTRVRLAGPWMWEVLPQARVVNGRLRATDLRSAPPAPREPGFTIGGRLVGPDLLLAATSRLVVLADTTPRAAGIELLAVDEPDRPRLVGLLGLPSAPAKGAVDGELLWLEQGEEGDGRLSLIDLRLPALPDELGALELGRRAVRLEASGGIAWLATTGGVLLALTGGEGGDPRPSPTVTPALAPDEVVGTVILPWAMRP
jgi:hypothetical protein